MSVNVIMRIGVCKWVIVRRFQYYWQNVDKEDVFLYPLYAYTYAYTHNAQRLL